VYPHLITDLQQGVLIFVPSYLDFVRLRNFFRLRRKKGDADFVQCCEYVSFGVQEGERRGGYGGEGGEGGEWGGWEGKEGRRPKVEVEVAKLRGRKAEERGG
jgi:hypothetical protein